MSEPSKKKTGRRRPPPRGTAVPLRMATGRQAVSADQCAAEPAGTRGGADASRGSECTMPGPGWDDLAASRLPWDHRSEVTSVDVPDGSVDVSLDCMPDGIDFSYEPPGPRRPLHLCVMTDAEGRMVGSGYGRTKFHARMEACAQYRRGRIRLVTVGGRKVEREPHQPT